MAENRFSVRMMPETEGVRSMWDYFVSLCAIAALKLVLPKDNGAAREITAEIVRVWEEDVREKAVRELVDTDNAERKAFEENFAAVRWMICKVLEL